MKAFHTFPVPLLAPFIDRLWGWEGQFGEMVQLPTLLPGTGAELFLHYNTPFEYLTQDNHVVNCPRGHLLCLRHNSLRLLPSSNLGFIAVRFKAGVIHRFTSMPVGQLFDQVTPVEEVWGGAASSFLSEIPREATLSERLSCIQSFLIRHLKTESKDFLIEHAVLLIYRQFSSVSINNLAESFHLGVRQFERRFVALTGNTPNEFRCLSRFQHTLRKLMLDTSTNSREIALSHGYYDQAHFINDFRRRVCCAPERYLKEARAKTHFYNTSWHSRRILRAPEPTL